MKTTLFGIMSLLLAAFPVLAAQETLTVMGGQTIKVLYFEPDTVDSTTPLAILLAGGANNEFMARTQFWMGKEMVNRGWAIAIPVSPGGREFFSENAALFPQLIADIRRTHQLHPAKTLLVGISSGGSAALAIASYQAGDYLGVVAAPGRVHGDLQPDQLKDLPVYLRVGEKDDFRWDKRMKSAIERLEAAGARVDAKLVPGARHVFPLDWDELEIWLTNALKAQAR